MAEAALGPASTTVPVARPPAVCPLPRGMLSNGGVSWPDGAVGSARGPTRPARAPNGVQGDELPAAIGGWRRTGSPTVLARPACSSAVLAGLARRAAPPAAREYSAPRCDAGATRMSVCPSLTGYPRYSSVNRIGLQTRVPTAQPIADHRCARISVGRITSACI